MTDTQVTTRPPGGWSLRLMARLEMGPTSRIASVLARKYPSIQSPHAAPSLSDSFLSRGRQGLMSILKTVSVFIGKFTAASALVLLMTGCSMFHKSAPAMPAVPFNGMVIRHTVSDYSKWKPIFDADASERIAAGVHAIGVARGIENPNDIEIPAIIDDVQKAKAFAADPRLKDVMQKAGVTGAPDIEFIRVLRMTNHGKCDYAEVTVKVKDFDAWLKVFDAEGAAVRKKDGITDFVLGRGIDDPNLVYLVFKINSIAEVNAAMSNPARQKLMQEGGVIGQPAIYFGRDQ